MKARENTLERTLEGGITLHAIGMPINWTLAVFQQETPEATEMRKVIATHLISVAKRNGVHTILAPMPTQFNAKVCQAAELVVNHYLGESTTLKRGAYADGVELAEGEAFCASSADCSTTVVRHPPSNRVWVAHCGLNSLIDKSRVEGRGPSREPESIVDAICAAVPSTAELEVDVCMGISAEEFRYPAAHATHGDYNRKLIEYLCYHFGRQCIAGMKEVGAISLYRLIQKQFALHGVPESRVRTDGICTASERTGGGELIWWSQARDSAQGTIGRNLVVVARST